MTQSERIEDLESELRITKNERDKWKRKAEKLAKIIGANVSDIGGFAEDSEELSFKEKVLEEIWS